MARLRLYQLFALLICGSSKAFTTGSVSINQSQDAEPAILSSDASSFALLPGIYRNVSVGQAWVYPSSNFDLGARSMTCECFNPDSMLALNPLDREIIRLRKCKDQCCMPKTNDLAPFCTPLNSTCCGNTFCVEGETCCGDFCCAEGTICNLKLTGSGCCPKGALCSNFAACYDHASSNCTNTLLPKQQCCPKDSPYCRDISQSGVGCYASSTYNAPSAIGSMAAISNPFSTASMTASTTTITIPLVSNADKGFSLEFPSLTASGTNDSIMFVIDWPTPAPVSTNTAAAFLSISTFRPTTAVTAASTTTSSTTTSATSPLCFNPDLQTPAPCSSSTTANPSSTTNADFSPAGASILHSQGMRLLPPFSLDWLFPPTYEVDASFILCAIFSAILVAIALSQRWRPNKWTEGTQVVHDRRHREAYKMPPISREGDKQNQPTTSTLIAAREHDIHLIPDSGRAITSASHLGREITTIHATARASKPISASDIPDEADLSDDSADGVPLLVVQKNEQR